ncbi:hypothetical protein [Bradyrhizobium genosp. SA-3]|nr:hypothetical protein [Bradyrhizobium genosp. SA-3]
MTEEADQERPLADFAIADVLEGAKLEDGIGFACPAAGFVPCFSIWEV